ncbi:transporter substrate-binding domain-containing protein [Paenibacillus sp. GYB003]|uniref:transporter substrate-binding domain-containing protein n=1 Tax=Paenibacillus sp. GYB003 TaxID=2994392 RepID=UPI002F96B682
MNNGWRRRMPLPLLLLLLLSLAIAAATAGCGQDKTLKVGMESDFRPFTYTEGGVNKGFEVELWDAIAQKGGIRYELVPMESRELVPALKAGKVDLVIAGMTVNKARKDELAFSDPYFQTGLVMATAIHNNDIRGKEDLAGKTVATKLDTTAYTFAGRLPKLKGVSGYPDINQAYDDLIAGRADCVIFDERGVHEYVQNAGKGKVKIVGEVLNKESYAIAAKKRNVHIGKVNSAIEQIAGNGTYDSLYIKWFGSKPQKLPGQ